MNIGIICYPSIGGSGVIASELGKALAEKGHSIHFISYDLPFRLKESIVDNEKIFFHKVIVNNYALFKYPPFEFSLASKIAEVAVTYNLEILHVHYAMPHVICAYLAKQMLKDKLDIKIVTTIHGTDVTVMGKDQHISNLLQFGLHETDAITAVSNHLAMEAENTFNLNNQIRTIYNFIDTNEFNPTKFDRNTREKYAKTNEKILIHVSNLRSVKRPMDILYVFNNLKQSIPCKLLIVGSGPNEEVIRKYIVDNILESNVLLIGEEVNLGNILSVGDLFLLPSELESFGLAALEAMASGLPVVATKTGGLPELIEHGKTGFLAEVGDIQGITDYCYELLTNDRLRLEFSAQSLERSRSLFNKEQIVNQYEDIFLSLRSVM